MIDFLLRASESHQSDTPSTWRPEPPEVVPHPGLLDLDDLGAELAEERGAHRRRDERGEVQDDEAVERAHVR